ncbi:Bacteriophage Lambda NinG protein [Serratia grimesii]|uniref:recombination protein NinG n=1 Tax=Serratia grimesii TaxID=82995 RepID=UPI002178AB6D|nr:recombination protein NinG [Serratia grimesii]CAI1837413.1 Bacteriophage Lambda NinG protein [Serratia grimesii]
MAKGIKPPKPKTCKNPACKHKFIPDRPLQFVCSPICAYQYQKWQKQNQQKQAEAESRREWNKRKADVKPLKHWEDLTQRVFNDFIRERDRDEPCISCGTYQAYEWHAGHFRTVAKASQLRYSEDNANKQCHSCNTHLSGNINPYRVNIVAKIGLERVMALENDNKPHRYTRDELEAIRKRYRAKLREMKKLQEAA